MSDRGGWDPWDFGDPEDEPWDEPAADDPAAGDPLDDRGWDENDADEAGPPRGALLAALGVMLVLAAAIAAIVLRGDDDGGAGDETASEVETDDEVSSTSSSSTSTSTSVAGSADGDPAAPAPTSTTATRAGSTTTRPPASTTTTVADEVDVPDCAHGGGGEAAPVPADWAARWETRPRPDDPARISICVDDVTPRVGQTVTVTLRGDDPDAVIVEEDCGYLLEWEGGPAPSCRDARAIGDGPRPTPPQEPGHVIVRFTHVYGTPGTRTIVGSVRSSRWDGHPSPYASYAEARLPVTVRP